MKMINKMLKFLKIFLFFALLMQLHTVLAEQPTQLFLNYNQIVYDKKFHPGDSGTITITIQNTGGFDADKVEAIILDSEYIHAGGSWKLGTISPGQIRTISVSIRVNKEISPGTYNIPLTLKYIGYKRTTYGLESNNEEINWNIPITIYGKENIQIIVEKENFKINTQENLILNVKTNENINDVSINLNSQCAQIIGSSKNFIGNLKKQETKKLNFKIKPLKIGACEIISTFEYYDVSGNIVKSVIPLGINVDVVDVDIKIKDVSYEKIIPGKSAKIKILLYNSGNDKARDVSINFLLNDPFIAVGSSEIFVGDLNAKEEKEIVKEIYIDKSAEIKTYNLLMRIRFKAGDDEKFINKTIGIFVEGEVELKIINYEMNYESSTLDVEIANKGTADAYSVEVIAYENDKIVDTKYTGSIGADKSKIFHLSIPKDEKDKKIKIVVTYKDQKEKFEKEIYIPYRKKGGNEILIIVAIFIIAIIGIYLWRKKKKAEKQP